MANLRTWGKKKANVTHLGRRESVVIIMTGLRAGRSGIRIPAWTRDLYHVHTDSVAHPNSHSMGTGVFFPGGKETETQG